MVSYHPRPFRDKHYETGAPQPGSKYQSQSQYPTGKYKQQFNVPHLPTIQECNISSGLTRYILGHIQYHKSDRGALYRIQDFQLLVLAD